MKLGVLDIGSNSAQLQVVEVFPGAPPLPAHAVKEPTRLGDAFELDGSISRGGVDRLVAAVGRAMDAARQMAVEKLFAFATSAVRDATNREQIVARIEREAGVLPQFLTGEDEARLTYLAVHSWYGWSAGRLLVMDIGGGTMEIAFGRGAEPDLAVSLPLGAGRLTRAVLPDDPPTPEQLKALRRYVRGALREVSDRLRWEGPPSMAVATSKTFKQMARLTGAAAQRRGPFVPRTLRVDDVARWLPRLAERDEADRARLPGISVTRARQIVAGAVVAKQAMRTFSVSSVEVSPWALREGIMLHYLNGGLGDTGALPLQPVTPEEPPGNVLTLSGHDR
jgi:exopolyphosphatase/guanosine-5'-triphosphate,3'-diphosphate pyrophosphatase